MRARAIIGALAILNFLGMTLNASADETKIRVGALDAVLTVPADVERPPVIGMAIGPMAHGIAWRPQLMHAPIVVRIETGERIRRAIARSAKKGPDQTIAIKRMQ